LTDIEISTNLGILTERIESSRNDIAEIKAAALRSEARDVLFEKTYVAERELLVSKTELASARIDNNTIKIAEIKTELYALTESTRAQLLLLTQAIQPLVMTSRVLMWIAGVVGAAITALVIAVITGQVQLVFK